MKQLLRDYWHIFAFVGTLIGGYVTLGRTVDWHTKAIRKQGGEIRTLKQYAITAVPTMDAIAQKVLSPSEIIRLEAQKAEMLKLFADNNTSGNNTNGE